MASGVQELGDHQHITGVLVQCEKRLSRLEQAVSDVKTLLTSATPKPEWFTTDQFATEVDRAPFTVRAWCNAGRLKAEKLANGREWRLHRDELDRYRREGLLQS